jgi:hypothetical protein
MSGFLFECDKCGDVQAGATMDLLGAPCPGMRKQTAFGLPVRCNGKLRIHADWYKHHPEADVPLEAMPESSLQSDTVEPPDDYQPSFDFLVACARASKRTTRMLKRLYPDLQTFRLPCVRCHLPCLIAKSSKAELDHAEEDGRRGEVICNDCMAEAGIPDPGAMTAGQLKEFSYTLMKRTVERENKN